MPTSTSYPGVCATKCGTKIRIQFSLGKRGERKRYSWTLEISPTQRGLANASRILEERRTRVLSGLTPIEESATNPLVSELAENWVRHLEKRKLKKRTINSYISSLNNHWFPGIAHLRVGDIRFALLRDIDESVIWGHPKTRTNAIAAISSLLQFAYEGDLIESNFARKFRHDRRQRHAPEAYKASERDKLIIWLRENAPPTPAMYFTMGFGSGMRVGELLGLHWSKWDGQGFNVDMTMQRGEITDTKTHESRYVPVLPKLRSQLLFYRAEQMKHGHHQGYVFLNQYGRPYTRSDKLNRWFHNACRATRVRDLMSRHAPYPWRATFVTLAYDAGIDPYVVADIAGHSVETARKHYKSHRQKETLRKAIQALD